MADRKVLVKYYPPDFDPEKLAHKARLYRSYESKKRKGVTKQMNVRFMFPFTMCCATCNEFIYIGTKFNSRVERVKGEDYLGITIWRFYGHCPHCRADIQFKTDPQNTEYILESGGTRTYDQRKDATLAEETLKGKLEEELGDSIRALEHKTHNTANELMTLEQLDELRKINKRMLNRESTLDSALDWLKKGGVKMSQSKNIQDLELSKKDCEDLEQAIEEMEDKKFQGVFKSQEKSDSSEVDQLKNNQTDFPENQKIAAGIKQRTQKKQCIVRVVEKCAFDSNNKAKATQTFILNDYNSSSDHSV